MAAAFNTRAAGQGGRGVGESLILKRRQREDHLASYVDCVKGLGRANSRAEWEHTLHTRSEDTQVQRTAHRLKNQHESQLHSRRLRFVCVSLVTRAINNRVLNVQLAIDD